jgi:hypothetical protein
MILGPFTGFLIALFRKGGWTLNRNLHFFRCSSTGIIQMLPFIVGLTIIFGPVYIGTDLFDHGLIYSVVISIIFRASQIGIKYGTFTKYQ